MKVSLLYEWQKELSKDLREVGFSEATKLDLTIGKIYPVSGISLTGNVLDALIVDESGKPNWYPIAFLNIENKEVPSNWQLSTFKNKFALKMIVGLPCLTEDGFIESLIEREHSTLERFFDEFSSLIL